MWQRDDAFSGGILPCNYMRRAEPCWWTDRVHPLVIVFLIESPTHGPALISIIGPRPVSWVDGWANEGSEAAVWWDNLTHGSARATENSTANLFQHRKPKHPLDRRRWVFSTSSRFSIHDNDSFLTWWLWSCCWRSPDNKKKSHCNSTATKP